MPSQRAGTATTALEDIKNAYHHFDKIEAAFQTKIWQPLANIGFSH